MMLTTRIPVLIFVVLMAFNGPKGVKANCSLESNPAATAQARECAAETRDAGKGKPVPEGGMQEVVCQFVAAMKEDCLGGFEGCSDDEMATIASDLVMLIKSGVDSPLKEMFDNC